MITVHDLRGSSHRVAYDYTQYMDDVHDGDVFLVDGGVALLFKAWPIMVIGSSSELHMLSVDSWDKVKMGQKYRDSILVAWATYLS